MNQITERRTAMADTVSMALAELVRKAEEHGDVDFLRDGVRVLSQALMEVDVSQHLGAERHERTAERSGQRNGYREREWDTRVGTILRQAQDAAGAAGAGWELLPGHAGAPTAKRAGAGGGGPRGVRQGRVDAAGRRPGESAGVGRDLEEPGQSAVRDAGRGSRAVPGASTRRQVSLYLVGCHVREGPGRWPGRRDGGRDRDWRQRRWPAGSARARRRAE